MNLKRDYRNVRDPWTIGGKDMSTKETLQKVESWTDKSLTWLAGKPLTWVVVLVVVVAIFSAGYMAGRP